MLAAFKNWVAKQERKAQGKFVCPACGANEFVMVTNPVFSTSSRSESRAKVMSRCGNGLKPCVMRYVFVSNDYGKTWDPYAPSN